MSPSERRSIPVRAAVASDALWLLAILCWPDVAAMAVPLDWYLGDLRPALRAMSVGCALGAVATLIARARVDALLRSAFPSRRYAAFSAAALLLSIVVCLAAGELALRALHLPFSASWEPSENAIGRFDAELGWSYAPNTSGVQRAGSDERPVPVAIDGHGARVPGARRDLVPGRPTLLLVGGSFTMGHGLTYEESLAGQLERVPDFPLQVANFAVQGYGTDQSLLQLRRHIASFDTRGVVYGYICDHVRRNATADRRLMYPGGRFLGTKPLFRLDGRGDPVLVDRPVRYEDRAQFRILDLIRIALVHYGPIPRLDLTRALVRQMALDAGARGIPFAVLDWDMDSSTDPACHAHPFADLGVRVIRPADTAPPGWSTWTLPGDLHPDARATHFAAETLARAIQDVSSSSGR
jgi:hypothetical protein